MEEYLGVDCIWIVLKRVIARLRGWRAEKESIKKYENLWS
jgi:hypothetical protein